MASYIKVNGTWRLVAEDNQSTTFDGNNAVVSGGCGYVKVNGAWRGLSNSYVKVAGTWRNVCSGTTSTPTPTPTPTPEPPPCTCSNGNFCSTIIYSDGGQVTVNATNGTFNGSLQTESCGTGGTRTKAYTCVTPACCPNICWLTKLPRALRLLLSS